MKRIAKAYICILHWQMPLLEPLDFWQGILTASNLLIHDNVSSMDPILEVSFYHTTTDPCIEQPR